MLLHCLGRGDLAHEDRRQPNGVLEPELCVDLRPAQVGIDEQCALVAALSESEREIGRRAGLALFRDGAADGEDLVG